MDADQKWMMPAKLINISSSGGLMCPRNWSRPCRRICLLFDKLEEAGWFEAEVVRSEGPGEVGIRFLSPLRGEFVRATTRVAKARRNVAESKTT